ncbi:ferritin-like domain-containing protein [Lysobacter sp. D1-1-M9]|uniref:ferritin-like domain-containing protein n=1 Tax=Novilysobacter longmucuonensis TaxID=3098603 RepID=UPI002FC59F98
MENKTSVGTNRSGIRMSPIDADALLEVTDMTVPTSPGDATALNTIRADYIAEADGLGAVPPPSTIRGAASTAIAGLTGHHASVLIDKLGERLAFERGGVRLYDAFVGKLEMLQGARKGGSNGDGWPPMDTVKTFRDEELAHAHLLADALEKLGADPTAQTPCANLTGVMNMGLMQAMTDPRTDLAQSLQVLLVAEVADGEGWGGLIALAEDAGQSDLAGRFRRALAEEERHATSVRTWYRDAVAHDASVAPTRH